MSTSDQESGPRRIAVVDADGVRGWMEETGPRAHAAAAPAQVSVRMDSGLVLSVPRALLVGPIQGVYTLQVSFAQVTRQQGARRPGAARSRIQGDAAEQDASHEAARVVPVLAEKLVVTKRPVVTGRVRLTRRVRSRDEAVDGTVQVERVDIERVPINRMVETAPETRYEGDTMVIPVIEEVIVVEKRLMLREELRITKRRTAQPFRETVTLRAEEVTVERLDSTGRKRPGARE